MTAWVRGGKLDAAAFAHHFFDRDADDPVVGALRSAVSEAAFATTQPQLAEASGHLAEAMTRVGLYSWPRFVADAQARARDPATVAAIERSLRPPDLGQDAIRPVHPVETALGLGAAAMTGGTSAVAVAAGRAVAGAIASKILPDEPTQSVSERVTPPAAAESPSDLSAVDRLQPPSVPPGMTQNVFGKTIIKWGSGAAAAANRADTLTSRDIDAMIEGGLTKEMAQAWRDFYENASLFRRGGEVAPARAKLLEKILENWPGGES